MPLRRTKLSLSTYDVDTGFYQSTCIDLYGVDGLNGRESNLSEEREVVCRIEKSFDWRRTKHNSFVNSWDHFSKTQATEHTKIAVRLSRAHKMPINRIMEILVIE